MDPRRQIQSGDFNLNARPIEGWDEPSPPMFVESRHGILSAHWAMNLVGVVAQIFNLSVSAEIGAIRANFLERDCVRQHQSQ
jgi:hypothetical protein